MITSGNNGGGQGKPRTPLQTVTIRFAGDSGDGMQLTGGQFSDACAIAGNDIATLPDFPSEIRAPVGTVAGVSGFQLQFASRDVQTPGDEIDVLVAMNPAALKVSLARLKPDGLIIVNEDSFNAKELAKADLPADCLDGALLKGYTLYRVPMTRLTQQAVADLGVGAKEADRCKNMFALGLVCWLFDRPTASTEQFIRSKFAKKPQLVEANLKVLGAGHQYGESAELFTHRYTIDQAPQSPGTYRKITGNQAAALGLVAAAQLAGKKLFYGSYPITPASEILHELSRLKNFGVVTFQAEDEIAAMGATVGAAFGGHLAATGTSGPGMALKSEMIGLAVMAELPVVIVNVQRGGPSTGLPTKTEQSDLHQAIFGRHGESPVVVLAAASPGDCFEATLEAARIAIRYMVPVVVLSDSYLAQGAEPWRVPDFSTLAPIPVTHPTDPATFKPYQRNEELARPWAIPGTPGLMHRLGGLEKQDVTGQVSHDPANHEKMVRLRAAKVAGVKLQGPGLLWSGPDRGELLVVGWGGTCGAIRTAVSRLADEGVTVSHCHLRAINPLPADLGERLKRFDRVLVVEGNLGQLRGLLRDRYLVDAAGFNRIQGQPLAVGDIARAIRETLKLRLTAEGANK
ncbi:MAG: 2-oxoglutarate oxidoreductase subunit KorA [Phycisphaerae bacterium]|nr:2-oxoglutarate oxidoreductase subunit KorA [Phycisphaerae bacterium]